METQHLPQYGSGGLREQIARAPLVTVSNTVIGGAAQKMYDCPATGKTFIVDDDRVTYEKMELLGKVEALVLSVALVAQGLNLSAHSNINAGSNRFGVFMHYKKISCVGLSTLCYLRENVSCEKQATIYLVNIW